MRILVTGGAGFIGSHAAERLVAAGHDVAVLDDLSSGSRANVPAECRLFEVDVRDGDGIGRAFTEWRPEAVCHLAAQIAVRVSLQQPDFDADVNVVGGLRLLRACRDAGVGRFVFVSTGGVLYGEPDRLPADETSPIRPIAPYALSKHTFERYLEMWPIPGMSTIVLRPANIYGPRQDPHGEAGVVAIFIGQMLRDEPVRIFGSGDQARDFVYVDDMVAALSLAVESDRTGAYNIGSGRLASVNELFGELARLTAYGRQPEYRDAIEGEVFRIALDGTKAERELGWRPSVPLDEGLRRTVKAFVADR